jgi:hypothetical protein
MKNVVPTCGLAVAQLMRSVTQSFCIALFLGITPHALADISDVPGLETRRYVVDQRDGTKIAGAIVIATWHGRGGLHQGSSCNRIESYVSGADGSIVTPNDRESGFVITAAYKKGYEPGAPPRLAMRGVDGNFDHWQVLRYRHNADNTRAEIDSAEAPIYFTEQDAQLASRQFIDVYVQKDNVEPGVRLQHLHQMVIAASCMGPTKSTRGARLFLESIYKEQVELGDDPRQLAATRRFIELARPGR